MRILIDMNLSPEWEDALRSAGWPATHWSRIGRPDASDREIMSWARKNDHVLLTHDLDFGSILAVSKSDSPSVIQIRTQNLTPSYLVPFILRVLSQFQEALTAGALVSVDETTARARVLPLM
ncbi:MAG: hypothetical protein CVU57_24250 [Deltaproteobacteria bacterium HGW-Deltaproteobacteria-15]|jgi:predicted nuclease of predicted toxin-antitoxin system|nr:MAG: hypothetical protein CVU57_24250 [Deltaproteobacteria bacterium HGW-Deltaproteobacteria-15]